MYDVLREGVPKLNSTWYKRIQVVITSGMRDYVKQRMLFCRKYIYRNEIFVCRYNHICH